MPDQANRRIAEFTSLSRVELRDLQGGRCPSIGCFELHTVKVEGKSVVRTTSGGIDSLICTHGNSG